MIVELVACVTTLHPQHASRSAHRTPLAVTTNPSRRHGQRNYPTPLHRWGGVARCESGGNWHDTAGMFDGGLQFLPSTWAAYGGTDYAATADLASRLEQITVAERVLAEQGTEAWPNCSYLLLSRSAA